MLFAVLIFLLVLTQSHSLLLPGRSRVVAVSKNAKRTIKTSTGNVARQSYCLQMSSYDGDEERSGFPLKVLGGLVIGVLGIFGTGFISSMQGIVKDANAPQSAQLKQESGEVNRGSMTKLTRREVNNKLQQVPVFFLTADEGRSIYTSENNEGILFTSKAEADIFAKRIGKGVKVSATSLDDPFYTLIKRKTKLGKFVSGVSANSNTEAKYRLYPSQEQVVAAGQDWSKIPSHAEDVPLFRVPKLAFQKESGMELPLFLRREDAISAFERLQENKKSDGKTIETTPAAVQTTSLLDVVGLWESGGFEGRAFEIYPAMNDIEEARSLMMATQIDDAPLQQPQ